MMAYLVLVAVWRWEPVRWQLVNSILDNYRVPVADGTSMLVFTEGATGVRATYWFQLNKNQQVWIGVANGDENIIYIHAMMRSE
jgi:hypothetical protein